MEISLTLAFFGGIFSFLSPCVLPVVPAYLSFLLGNSLEENCSRRDLLIQTSFFILGFSTVFLLMGISASQIGQALSEYREFLSRLGGILVLMLGLHLLGILKLSWLMMERRVEWRPRKFPSARALLLGLSFAAGWTPCIGPVLSGILILAATADHWLQGGLLLLLYSLGLALPFLLCAALAGRIVPLIRRSGRILLWVQRVGGMVLVIFGLLLFFDGMNRISALIPMISLPY